MKKIILSVLAVFAFGFANAQDEGGFKVGVHAGLPIGDSADLYSVNLGVDAAYLFPVSAGFTVGATTGYSMFSAKEYTAPGTTLKIKGSNAGFVPVAATAQYLLTESLFLGVDLGYALYVGEDENGDGGFLYQPKIGYQMENLDLFVSYKGISGKDSTYTVGGVTTTVSGGAISTIGIGAAYRF